MKYTLIIFSENKPGVLYRIADVFLRRKINIDSLTVSEIPNQRRSRFTIVLNTDEQIAQKVAKQLEKIIEVLEVQSSIDEELLFHEVALIKIEIDSLITLNNLQRILDQTSGKLSYFEEKSVIIEHSGTEKEIEELLKNLNKFIVSDIAVSGRIAIRK